MANLVAVITKQSNIFAPCGTVTHGTWYHSLHWQHSIMSLTCISGILQEQNTSISFLDLILVAPLGSLTVGNVCNLPFTEYWCRCYLIFARLPGVNTVDDSCHKLQKKQQSLPPACICTSMVCKLIFDCSVQSINVILFNACQKNIRVLCPAVEDHQSLELVSLVVVVQHDVVIHPCYKMKDILISIR